MKVYWKGSFLFRQTSSRRRVRRSNHPKTFSGYPSGEKLWTALLNVHGNFSETSSCSFQSPACTWPLTGNYKWMIIAIVHDVYVNQDTRGPGLEYTGKLTKISTCYILPWKIQWINGFWSLRKWLERMNNIRNDSFKWLLLNCVWFYFRDGMGFSGTSADSSKATPITMLGLW